MINITMETLSPISLIILITGYFVCTLAGFYMGCRWDKIKERNNNEDG